MTGCMNSAAPDPWLHPECPILCVHNPGAVSYIHSNAFWVLCQSCNSEYMKRHNASARPSLHTLLCICFLQPGNPCLEGCRITLSTSISSSPASPIGTPSIEQSGPTGQFIVNFSNITYDLQNVNSSSPDPLPVVLLFKLEDVESHNVSFVWMVRPLYLVTLLYVHA